MEEILKYLEKEGIKYTLNQNPTPDEIKRIKKIMNKPRNYRSPVVQRLMDEMDKQPWHVKFKRWVKVQIWVYRCLIRKKRF